MERTRRRHYKTPEELNWSHARQAERQADLDARQARTELSRAHRRAQRLAAIPDEMPPVEEWDNPALRRKTEDFGDAMRLRRARIHGAATSRPVVRRLIITRDKST